MLGRSGFNAYLRYSDEGTEKNKDEVGKKRKDEFFKKKYKLIISLSRKDTCGAKSV